MRLSGLGKGLKLARPQAWYCRLFDLETHGSIRLLQEEDGAGVGWGESSGPARLDWVPSDSTWIPEAQAPPASTWV